MNFLAHFQLAAPDKSLMFGNYIADFITNKQLIDFSVPVRQGIMLHRAIDTFTDNHEATKSAIQEIDRRSNFVICKRKVNGNCYEI